MSIYIYLICTRRVFKIYQRSGKLAVKCAVSITTTTTATTAAAAISQTTITCSEYCYYDYDARAPLIMSNINYYIISCFIYFSKKLVLHHLSRIRYLIRLQWTVIVRNFNFIIINYYIFLFITFNTYRIYYWRTLHF